MADLDWWSPTNGPQRTLALAAMDQHRSDYHDILFRPNGPIVIMRRWLARGMDPGEVISRMVTAFEEHELATAHDWASLVAHLMYLVAAQNEMRTHPERERA